MHRGRSAATAETVPTPLPIVEVGAPTLGGLGSNHYHRLALPTWSHGHLCACTQSFVGFDGDLYQLGVQHVVIWV